jgi:hypothetical protein
MINLDFMAKIEEDSQILRTKTYFAGTSKTARVSYFQVLSSIPQGASSSNLSHFSNF